MGCLAISCAQQVAGIVLVNSGAIKMIAVGAIACRGLYLVSA